MKDLYALKRNMESNTYKQKDYTFYSISHKTWCEQEMPSSPKEQVKVNEGCVVGELINLDDIEGGNNKAIEVFLAEGRQEGEKEELKSWRWDEIKEEERKGYGQLELKDEAVQMIETEAERY